MDIRGYIFFILLNLTTLSVFADPTPIQDTVPVEELFKQGYVIEATVHKKMKLEGVNDVRYSKESIGIGDVSFSRCFLGYKGILVDSRLKANRKIYFDRVDKFGNIEPVDDEPTVRYLSAPQSLVEGYSKILLKDLMTKCNDYLKFRVVKIKKNTVVEEFEIEEVKISEEKSNANNLSENIDNLPEANQSSKVVDDVTLKNSQKTHRSFKFQRTEAPTKNKIK